jgi:hypothetical protein
MLREYGLKVGDVVGRSGGKIARIRDEFTFRAVVCDVQTGFGVIVSVSEFILIGRPNESAIVSAREFSRAVVDLDLRFGESDLIVSGDRIVTEKGMAMVGDCWNMWGK